MKKISLIFLCLYLFQANAEFVRAESAPGATLLGGLVNPRLIHWLKANISPATQLPYSFYITPEERAGVYHNMGGQEAIEGVIERMMTHQGLNIYDGAVYQIVLAMLGDEESLARAFKLIDIYWNATVGDLHNIRAGHPENFFIYDPQSPKLVASDVMDYGRRGFIFRIINADGKFQGADPLDGKKFLSGFPNNSRLHWEDWKPVAGENAWVTMAAMHLYKKKYDNPVFGYPQDEKIKELALAKELARAAMILQSEIGGVRMAPLGTHRELLKDEKGLWEQGTWWYNQISTENNISWYSAFRMLYEVTGNPEYKVAMNRIEDFLHFMWNPQEGIFYQGATFRNGHWVPNREHFALDVQTWSIVCFGPGLIDQWFGEGTAFRIWQKAKEYSGVFDKHGNVLGVGFTGEHDRISIEWSAGGLMALQEIIKHYKEQSPALALEAALDMYTMRRGMEILLKDVSPTQSAYSYSSQRGWIPFGWNSHDPHVLSLASTAWIIFVDAQFNPFRLDP